MNKSLRQAWIDLNPIHRSYIDKTKRAHFGLECRYGSQLRRSGTGFRNCVLNYHRLSSRNKWLPKPDRVVPDSGIIILMSRFTDCVGPGIPTHRVRWSAASKSVTLKRNSRSVIPTLASMASRLD